MTPSCFRECLASLHWGATTLSKILCCDDRLVRRWMSGERPVPDAIAAWVLELAAHMASSPPPQDWKSRG